MLSATTVRRSHALSSPRRGRRTLAVASLALVGLCVSPAAAPAAGWALRPPVPAPGVGSLYVSSADSPPGLVRSVGNNDHLWRITDRVQGFEIRSASRPGYCLQAKPPPGDATIYTAELTLGSCGTAARATYQLWRFRAVLGNGTTLERPPSGGNNYQIYNVWYQQDDRPSCLTAWRHVLGEGFFLGGCGRYPVQVWRMVWFAAP